MRRLSTVCTLLAASLGLAIGFPASGDEADELEEMLRAQGEMIEQLREEVGRLRAEHRQSEHKILALEDQLALPAVSSGSAGDGEVTPAYVDSLVTRASPGLSARWRHSNTLATGNGSQWGRRERDGNSDP